MEDIPEIDPRVSIQSIPMDIRPAVAEWLIAMAAKAQSVSEALRNVGRKVKSSQNDAQIVYWKNVASGARWLAQTLDASALAPDRRPGGPKDGCR